MKYNWKFIRTKGGKVTFALCIGDKCEREFKTIAMALKAEESREFEKTSQSIVKYLKEQKRCHEAWWKENKNLLPNIIFTESSKFRAEQRKLNK